MERFAELKQAIEQIELVDGHAHNVVAVDSSFPFIKCFTEADGVALAYAPHSLSFKRGIRELAELYGCKPSFQDIEDHRKRLGVEAVTSICFKAAKVSALLIDDGIQLDKAYDIKWHNTYAPSVGRILRIERLAAEILDKAVMAGSNCTVAQFTHAFQENLTSAAHTLVGLKSVAAYRSGLEINPKFRETDLEAALTEVLSGGKPIRITNKTFIDYVFTLSLEVAVKFDLPVQIHTGFGDKDLDLRLANPLHLRAVLEDKRFLKSRIVLLHASYPFSKEASYLASVYPQIFLDFGLAVPKLSVHGMVSSVKELLELAPINKVMFSTDGYAFPETFYLGARKAREVIFSALQDACIDGDLSISEAMEAAKSIFAQNAVQFYKLNIPTKPILENGITDKLANGYSSPCDEVKNATLVRLLWVDTSGQCRCRAVPSGRFNSTVKKNGVGLTHASMGMCSYVDTPAPGSGLSGVGEVRLIPDLSTKHTIPWLKHEEMVLADMHVRPGEAWEYCPRDSLRRVLKILKDEFDLEVNAGFENEFFLLKSIVTREGKEEWVPFDSTPYCSSQSFDAASPFLQDVLSSLEALNIPVEQIHAEAGKGQLELALGHKACTLAADNLIFAREVIKGVARKHGYLATFMPKFAMDDIGSGSHVHLSVWRNGVNVFMGKEDGGSHHGMSKVGQHFMAGVLHHLPAILAFTTPHPNSYARLQPNTWSGAYQCWGKENREAPVRTACPPGIPDGLVSNFEIKSFDGIANPYLGLASIIAAGIDGLRKHLTLPDPIDVNPDDADKIPRLPTSLSEAMDSLEKDALFEDLIGSNLLTAIKAVRQAEESYYSENKEAYKKLIYIY